MLKMITIGVIVLLSVGPLHSETIKVRVLDSFEGTPVDAAVTAIVDLKLISARTDETGTATLNVPLLGDSVWIVVRGMNHGVKCVEVKQTKNGDMKISVSPSMRIHGIIRDDNSDSPIRSAAVKVQYLDEYNCPLRFNEFEERTNNLGQFALRNVDPGRKFKIVVMHNSYSDLEIDSYDLLKDSNYPTSRSKELTIFLRAE